MKERKTNKILRILMYNYMRLIEFDMKDDVLIVEVAAYRDQVNFTARRQATHFVPMRK